MVRGHWLDQSNSLDVCTVRYCTCTVLYRMYYCLYSMYLTWELQFITGSTVLKDLLKKTSKSRLGKMPRWAPCPEPTLRLRPSFHFPGSEGRRNQDQDQDQGEIRIRIGKKSGSGSGRNQDQDQDPDPDPASHRDRASTSPHEQPRP